MTRSTERELVLEMWRLRYKANIIATSLGIYYHRVLAYISDFQMDGIKQYTHKDCVPRHLKHKVAA